VDADELDAHIRALISRGDIERATERVLRAYGDELARYLLASVAVEADAHEAFSRMSEELWRSLPRFDGRCSVRTWCYMLARCAAVFVRSQPRHAREVLVSQIPSIQQAATKMWSTSIGDAVQVRAVYAEIRQELDDDEQTLLALRVDRNLAWHDIAVVLLGEGADDDALARKSSALRKQFERVKDRLRALAAERLDG